ncbi:MAG: helix-turn-helix domain-containing protein [Pseudomonadota bacterium]
MSPKEFKEARHALGLSAKGMARALKVESGRTIRRWESGERDIPGPAIVAVQFMIKLGVTEPDEVSVAQTVMQ